MKVRVGDLPGQCNYYCASYILGYNPEEERDKGYPKVCKLLEQKKIRLAKDSHQIDTYSILSYQREEEEVRLRLVERILKALRDAEEKDQLFREEIRKRDLQLMEKMEKLAGNLEAIRADIKKLQIENVKKVRVES